MNKSIYINGIHTISPQPTFDNSFLDKPVNDSSVRYLRIIAPSYKDFISGKQLRRMATIMRLGIVGALRTLEDANIANIDAIIIGSGHGNISDTQKFMNAIIDNGERLLVPTSFVQSTPNIVAGSIALRLENKAYNMTYSHHSTAFEMALLDAMMLFEENTASTILVGGLDELTEENTATRINCDLWLKKEVSPLELIRNTSSAAAMHGESSSFFVLADSKSENTYAQLLDVALIYLSNSELLKDRISAFLKKNQLISEDIDIIIGGLNGVADYDHTQLDIWAQLFSNAVIINYKQYVGEHPTASAFAFWMAAQILSGKNIPETAFYKPKASYSKKPKHLLIFQKSYLSENDYAMTLLRTVD